MKQRDTLKNFTWYNLKHSLSSAKALSVGSPIIFVMLPAKETLLNTKGRDIYKMENVSKSLSSDMIFT